MKKLVETNIDNYIDCPVCGKEKVREYDVCGVCNWENDPHSIWYPSTSRGANKMTLDEARKAWKNGLAIE